MTHNLLSRTVPSPEVAVPLTIRERRMLDEKAKQEMRSVSNYVTRLVLDELVRK